MSLNDCRSGERKIDSYYSIYDKEFGSHIYKELKLLEIGVQDGGSLKMWSKYFPNATIVGVDIDPHCKQHETDKIKVIIGDQADENFCRQFTDFDIVIDDGGHTTNQQQVSFNTIFPLMKSGGIYVIEDLHTSYWPQFQDSQIPTTKFIAELIDTLNVDATKNMRAQGRTKDVPKNREIAEIHFYPSICFIVKK